MRQHRKALRSKGQNLVEFALTIPFVLIFFLFVVEIGRAWFFYEAIKTAANEGAQTAAMYQNPSLGRRAVLLKLQAANIMLNGIPQVSQVTNEHAYQVTVSGYFQPIFGQPTLPFINVKLLEPFPITYTALKQYTVY